MTKPSRSVVALSIIFLSSIFLTACGGGDSPSPSAPPPPPPTGPTWTSGVFEPASQFKDRCETVRIGADIEGNPFPDRSGSTLEENFWLRSWTNETYLWNREVTDRNPAGFSNRLDYFAVLRTTATTPSGRDKDEFHFSQPTDEYLALRNAAPLAGYGAAYIQLTEGVPRDFRVLYTEPGSPAAEEVAGQPNFVRGTRILEVNGVDLVNANSDAEIDILNDGLFPPAPNQQNTFVVQDPGSSLQRTVIMTSADIVSSAVNRTRIIDTPTGKVGYALINSFSSFASEKEVADAFASFNAEGVADVVIDLRYNGGGLLAVAAQLGYMTAGSARTSGRVFEGLRFNADAGGGDPVNGGPNNPLPFFSTGLGFSLDDGTPLQTLDLPRVFILTTDATCSASESVINSLRGIDVEVILIGGLTCGKPFGFFPQDNCGETYFTIQFQGFNDKGFGDYAEGFAPANAGQPFAITTPGCAVADDFDNELGEESEALLAAALQYRENGTCPTPPPISQAPAARISAASLEKRLGAPAGDVFKTNRDMTIPN